MLIFRRRNYLKSVTRITKVFTKMHAKLQRKIEQFDQVLEKNGQRVVKAKQKYENSQAKAKEVEVAVQQAQKEAAASLKKLAEWLPKEESAA